MYPSVSYGACARVAVDDVCARAIVQAGIRHTLINVCRIMQLIIALIVKKNNHHQRGIQAIRTLNTGYY